MDATTPVRIAHRVYGPGTFDRLLAPAGHARVQFDIDGNVRRRVLVRDLTPEPVGVRVVEDAAVAS